MIPERWARVKALFHAALEQEPGARAVFLVQACRDESDPAALRAEVERLLDAHRDAGSFIEEPALIADVPGNVLASLSGQVVGRYDVGRLIGTGGMGQVYAARDRDLGREVALKIAHIQSQDSSARLRREAQHASRLNHPNICTIHEIGVDHDRPFIVMELVEGQRLSERIPLDGLDAAEVLRLGIQIADGLAHAHQNGVTHRDLKSSNIVLTTDGHAKILDFGLARRRSSDDVKQLSQSQASLTSDGLMAGTLACMAPELLRGSEADARSDVWACGVLLHEMATGRRPFRGATGFELSGAILHQTPDELPERVPPSIKAIVATCLAKDPSARYESASALRDSLRDALRACGPGTGTPVFTPATPRVSMALHIPRVAVMLAAVLAGVAVIYGVARLGISLPTRPFTPQPSTSVSTSSRPALEQYTKGLDARRNYRLDEAERAFNQAVAIDPAFGEAYLQLGMVANLNGARDREKEVLGKAVEHRDRMNERNRMLLDVVTARASEDFAQAGAALEQLIATFPEVDASYEIAAQLYHPEIGPLANGDKMVALTSIGVAALPLSPLTRQSAGFALFLVGRGVDALREFEAYARLAPNEIEPLTSLGSTYALMGLPEKALEVLARAQAIAPDNNAIREGQSSALAMLGKFDEALAAGATSPGTRVVMLGAAGRYAEAKALANERIARARQGNNRQATANLLLLLMRMAVDWSDYAALDAYVRDLRAAIGPMPAPAQRPFLVAIDFFSGVVAVRAGHVDAAVPHLEAVQRTHLPTVGIERWMAKALEGEIALARGQLDAAARAFAEGEPPRRAFAYGLMGNHPPLTDGLARVAKARGDVPGAIAAYRVQLSQAPEHKWLSLLDARYVLEVARLLERSGDRVGAQAEYRRFLDVWGKADQSLPEIRDARNAIRRLDVGV